MKKLRNDQKIKLKTRHDKLNFDVKLNFILKAFKLLSYEFFTNYRTFKSQKQNILQSFPSAKKGSWEIKIENFFLKLKDLLTR